MAICLYIPLCLEYHTHSCNLLKGYFYLLIHTIPPENGYCRKVCFNYGLAIELLAGEDLCLSIVMDFH
jgi:hypothetical protein